MQFKTEDYFHAQLRQHNPHPESLETTGQVSEADALTYPIPERHSRVLPFAKMLVNLCEPYSELLICATEWGIWRSSENWHLFHHLRNSYGERASVKERPCHCFSSNESDIALDFVYLFVLFSWDFYIFSAPSRDLIFLSHDGYVRIHSTERLPASRLAFEDFLRGDMPTRLDS